MTGKEAIAFGHTPPSQMHRIAPRSAIGATRCSLMVPDWRNERSAPPAHLHSPKAASSKTRTGLADQRTRCIISTASCWIPMLRVRCEPT